MEKNAIMIAGYTSGDWKLIGESLQREITTLDTAYNAVVSSCEYKDALDATREEYIRLACLANQHYMRTGGRL
jgi:hypothetical protein